MIKIWRETADPNKHSDFMSTSNEGGIPIKKSRDNLIPKWVYLATVDNFTFQFANLDQIKAAKVYFEKKVHPSTRNKRHPPYEHYWHPWYCKLPKGITKKSKRQKVLKALERMLAQWA